MLYRISKTVVPLLFLFTILACDDDDSVSSAKSDEKGSRVDTIVVNTLDTVFVEKLDTVVVNQVDTVTVTPSGTIKKCRTDFDSSFVPNQSFFFGNSLLLGQKTFGLCASQSDKDYYSQLESYFKSHEIPFEGSRVTGNFENLTSLDDQEYFLSELVYGHLNDSTGLVVLQLGDNINDDVEFSVMEETVSHLMEQVCERAPNARVLWVGEWYSTNLKQFLLKRLASDFGITFVDISDLNVPENQSYVGAVVTYPEEQEFSMNYDSYETEGDSLTVHFVWNDSLVTSKIKVTSVTDSKDEKKLTWTGVEYIVPDEAVATHPNDKAFAEIYKRILTALGYSNP